MILVINKALVEVLNSIRGTKKEARSMWLEEQTAKLKEKTVTLSASVLSTGPKYAEFL